MKIWILISALIFTAFLGIAQNKIGQSKALVIGISHYQDPEIPDLQMPHRDAELFTTFLRTQRNNSIADENILLITNEQATGGRIASALDWLFENTSAQDTLILYFAGYGMESHQNSIPPSKLYFYDTPSSLNLGGSFDLFFQFQSYLKSRKTCFEIYSHFYPLLLAPELRNDTIQINTSKNLKSSFKNSSYLNTINQETYQKTYEEVSMAKMSLNHYLLDGLMGLADKNKNQLVTLKEIEYFLKNLTVIKETWPSLLFVAASSNSQNLNTTNPLIQNDLIQLKDQFLPSIVQFESNSQKDAILQSLSKNNQLLYQDFIVAIKLGHLMSPKESNASDILNLLLLQKEIISLYSDLRRKLAAALQDEVQQALNAYLNSDSREITKRRTSNYKYSLYPLYLQRASELLGNHHFMLRNLQAKRFYFEGLNKRMEGLQLKKMDMIKEALELQQKALLFEKEASFIYNEIAINYQILKQKKEAQKNFEAAIDYSPAWSIPFSNYSQLYFEDDLAKALRIAKHAIRLSPRNSYAYNVEGLVYLQSKDYSKAEVSFNKALQLDPTYTDAFYNMACLKSLQNDFESAKDFFESAIQNGFKDIQHALVDPDLNSFRKQTYWQVLLDKYFLEFKR